MSIFTFLEEEEKKNSHTFPVICTVVRQTGLVYSMHAQIQETFNLDLPQSQKT